MMELKRRWNYILIKLARKVNKFSFINRLLQNEKFNSSQKERVLKLVAKELENIKSSEHFILKEIELIKAQVGLLPENPKGNQFSIKSRNAGYNEEIPTEETADIQILIPTSNPKIASKEIEYLNPQELSRFLCEYNQNPILKYTCHNIDDEDAMSLIISKSGTDKYEFERHLELIIKEYKKLSSKYFGKVKNMQALIYTYLTGFQPGGWADDRIKINWSSDELKKWALQNPGKVPNPGDNFEYTGYEFVPIELKSVGEEPFLFKELVIHFKHLSHIRKDNSLRSRITRYNALVKLDENCSITFKTFPENIEFFTDVSKLIQAYGGIVKSSIEFAKNNDYSKPEIELSLREDNAHVYLDIHHKNSVYGTSLMSTTQERMGETQLNLIDNQINGLCDLILKADFDSNEYAELSLWPFKNKPSKLDSFRGVQFILKLYR